MKRNWRSGLILIFNCITVSRLRGGGVIALSNSDSKDSTQISSYPDALTEGAELLSAFYGLDDAIPFLAATGICSSFGNSDGMPVIFSKEVDIATLQAGDFSVLLSDGSEVKPGCVTPAPAQGLGEFRTMLMLGDFGSNRQSTYDGGDLTRHCLNGPRDKFLWR